MQVNRNVEINKKHLFFYLYFYFSIYLCIYVCIYLCICLFILMSGLVLHSFPSLSLRKNSLQTFQHHSGDCVSGRVWKLDELVKCNIAQAPADNEWQCPLFHLPGQLDNLSFLHPPECSLEGPTSQCSSCLAWLA